MGQGAVRSQMDTRICFRVRKRKDVDLVLGQGMLAAGRHAHTLNAPGKFLLSVPEHTAPRRARAYLATDDDVVRTVAGYADGRPEEESLWCALCVAPGDGTDIAELMRASGMSRPILYRRLNQLASHGRAIQADWGRWLAVTLGEGDDE